MYNVLLILLFTEDLILITYNVVKFKDAVRPSQGDNRPITSCKS